MHNCTTKTVGISYVSEWCISAFGRPRTCFARTAGRPLLRAAPSMCLHMRKVHGREPDIPRNRTSTLKDKIFVDTKLILQLHPELKTEFEN